MVTTRGKQHIAAGAPERSEEGSTRDPLSDPGTCQIPSTILSVVSSHYPGFLSTLAFSGYTIGSDANLFSHSPRDS